MQTFAVNNNNDLYLDSFGNIVIAYDQQAVLQSCSQAAQTLLGEMPLNTNQGIPYFQTVFNGIPNTAQFETALRIAFFNVPNVQEIVNLTITQQNNTLIYQATIRTAFGTGTISNGK